MASEFKIKNGLIVIGDVSTSGTITINGALAATQSYVASQGYLTSASLTSYATQSYVTSAIASLVDSAPGALDTLRELATALGNDASFSTTITNSIASKQSQLNGTGLVRMSGTSVSYDNTTYLISNFSNIEGEHSYGYPSSDGWYKIAEVVLNGTCQSYNLWGEYRDTGYLDNSHYRIHITARAECDFLSNNESHAINVNIYGSSTNETYFTNNVRVILTSSSSNYRKYELQYYRATWDTGSWRLQTLGWTTYTTSQTAGTPTGTPRVYYISKFVADNIYAANKISIGTSYSGFAANIAGTTYIIGASAWVNDAYGYVNASSPGTGFFPYSDGNSVIASSNTTRLFVNGSTGNIGIGTNSPTKKLHVYTTDNEGIFLQGAGGGVWMDIQASGGQIHSVGAQVGGMGIYNRTSSSYRMFIADAGNFGIGTTSPSQKLEVSGNIKLTSGGFIYGDGSNADLQVSNNNGSVLRYGSVYIKALAASIKLIATSEEISLQNNNGTIWMNGAGNVGIGTTAPTSKFFVLGTGTYNTATSEILASDATIFSSEMSNDAYNSILQLVSVRQSLSTGNASNGFLGFSTIDDSNGQGIRDAGRIAIVNEAGTSRNSATSLSFWTNAGGTNTTAATEKMRITSGGNVGINNATPDSNSKLDVNGQVFAARFTMYNDNGTPSIGTSPMLYSPASGTMAFSNNSAERMRITSGGNVLIGTTTDSGYKLDVNGTGRFSGALSGTSAVFNNTSILSTVMGSPQLKLINSATSTINQRVDLGLRFEDGTYNGIGGISMVRESATARSSTIIIQPIASDGNPLAALSIASTGAATFSGTTEPQVTITDGTNSLIELRSSANAAAINFHRQQTAGTQVNIGMSVAGSAGLVDDLVFSFNNGTSWSERMRITSGGNVGIGTTSPADKLDVIGRVSAYRYIAVNSNAASPAYATDTNTGIFNAGSNIIGFSISSAEKMRIDTAGNVGIGTTSPSQKLEVNSGGAYMDTTVSYGTNTKGIVINQEDGTGYGTGLWFRQAGLTAGIGSTRVNSGDWATDLRFYTHPSSTTNQNTLYERMRINSEGNVGIGTTSPGYKLQVVGEIYTNYRVQINDGTANLIIGHWDGVNARIENSGRPLLITSYSQPINMSISGSGPAFSLKADSNAYFTGSLGIGTTSPSTKLEVGNFLDAVTNKITVAARYEYEPEFNFKLGQSGTNYDWIGAVISSGDDGNYNGKILFKTANVGRDTPTTKMIIKASGNVGIGTTSPTYKLEVNGNLASLNSSAAGLFAISGTRSIAIQSFAGDWNYIRSNNANLVFGTQDAANLYIRTNDTDRIFVNTVGKVAIGTTDTNSDKSDFTVYTGAGATIALTYDQVRMGGTDVNWGVAIRQGGSFETYGQALGLYTANGNYPVNVVPNGTTSAQFYTDYTYFPGLDFAISRVNSTHGAGNFFRGDASHLVIGTGGTLYLNYAHTSGTTYIFGTTYVNNEQVATRAWVGSYSPTLTGGGASGSWGISITGSAGSISGFNNPATGATANTIAYRDGNGDLTVRELVLNVAVQGFTPSSMVAIYPTTNQAVKVNAAGVQAFLGLGSMAYADTGSYLALTGGAISGTLSIKNTSSLVQAPYQSDHDFPNGAYIQTDILVSNGDPWTCEITAFNYGNGRPTKITINAYNYGPGTYYAGFAIATGLGISGMSVFQNASGYLSLYIPTQGYWNAYNVNWYVNYRTNSSNRVTSISNSTKPTGISYENAINPTYSLDQSNYTTYTATAAQGTKADTAYSWGNHASYSYATTSYVTTQINNLIAGAPGALDTLNELATALGNDASFSTTVTNSIAAKLPLAGGNMTGSIGMGAGANIVFTGGSHAIYGNNTGYLHFYDYTNVYFNNQLVIRGGIQNDTGNVLIDDNLTVTGTITESSSLKLKENVKTSDGNLEKVVNLRPVTYNKIGSQTTELGLIAEEVAEVYPEFVQYDENGEPVGVNYSRLTAALIGAVKELTQRIETLENNG